MFLFMYREFLDFCECPIILIFCPKCLLLKYKILFPPLSYLLKVEFLFFFFIFYSYSRTFQMYILEKLCVKPGRERARVVLRDG